MPGLAMIMTPEADAASAPSALPPRDVADRLASMQSQESSASYRRGKYMDKAPLFKRIMLQPPLQAELEARETIVSYDHLLHQHGETTTPLVPAGKARFGREIIDVISDGPGIEAGTPVEVIEVVGNRVLVEPIPLNT